MTQRMEELAQEIVRLQAELDREIERRRKALGWSVKGRMAEFEHGLVAGQKQHRIGIVSYFAGAPLPSVLSSPMIYSLAIPFMLLDLWVSLYQAICFRAYRIPRVRRSGYIAFDRERLGYLNWVEALNCAYCGYVNGVAAYVREVAGRTEQYWCPIKHAVPISDPHQRYYGFLEFGDAEGYRDRLESFRERLREEAAERA